MRKAFTLVELMIVVAIIGILAAATLPLVQGHVTRTNEAAVKDDLRLLRTAIEYYTVEHNDVPPGYQGGDRTRNVTAIAFFREFANTKEYIQKMPKNPFNQLVGISAIQNSEEFPAQATGRYGWIYKAQTKEIRLDWPGTDSDGVPYYDY